jgi:isomerase DpgB
VVSAKLISLTVDGGESISADLVAAVNLACDRAEDVAEPGHVVVRVSGTPGPTWAGELTVGLLSKWERALRRLERLPAPTIAVADGDCGGPALDAFLATDHRIATPSTRLLMVSDGATPWPGMAVYRLGRLGAQQLAVRRLALFGVPLAAADALALHLVDELTDDPARVEAAAEMMAPFAGTDLTIRRQLMSDATSVGFEEAMGAHLAACDRLLRRHPEGAG